MERQDIDDILTPQQEDFCHLFVYGGREYAGKREKCFARAFGATDRTDAEQESRRLLDRTAVASRIKELARTLQTETEHIAIKLQVAETLKAVMEETASATFTDKFGIDLSPAPLRAVSVNAAKALMELYPIKNANESRLRVEGADGNVIFNVVVPDAREKNEDG